ncbi:MAG: M24 family metallopeptidase [Sulfolobales archaeon]
MDIVRIFINNIKRVFSYAEENKLGKMIILDESNQAWVSSLRIKGSVLAIDVNNKSLRYYTPALEYWRAEEILKRYSDILSIETLAYFRYKIEVPEDIKVFEGGYVDVVKKEFIDCLEKNVICGLDIVPQEIKEIVQEKYKDIKEDISSLRAIKSDEEISLIARATDISMKALEKVIDEGIIGYSEKIIAGKISYYMRFFGADQEAFPLIVASNENSAYPHAKSSSKTIELGDIVLIDIGARVSEYNSDMTRMILSKNSFREKHYVDAVEESLNKALEKIEIGAKASEIDAVARETLNKHGLGKFFIHSLGHGVGVDVHEKPALSSTSKDVLEKNMVVTVEPGIYFRDRFGIRIEDLVVVEERGPRMLTSMKRVLEY